VFIKLLQSVLKVNDRVTTGLTFWYDLFCREEFVQNMVRIVQYVRKTVVIGVGSQLRQPGVVGCLQVEPDSTSYGCFETPLVSRAGKTPPCR